MFTLRWLQYRESFCMNYWILNVPLARTPSVAPARPVRSGQLECLPVNVFYAWPFRKWITLSLYQNSYYITPNIYSIGIAFLSTVAIFRPCPFNVQVFTTWRSTCIASAIVNGTIPKYATSWEMIKEPGLCQIINSICLYGITDHLFVEIDLWITASVDKLLVLHCHWVNLSGLRR